MSDLNLMYNENPICPYCGEKYSNVGELGLEYNDDSTNVECGECCEEYEISTNAKVTYNTSKVGEQPNELT